MRFNNFACIRVVNDGRYLKSLPASRLRRLGKYWALCLAVDTGTSKNVTIMAGEGPLTTTMGMETGVTKATKDSRARTTVPTCNPEAPLQLNSQSPGLNRL